VTVLDGQLVVAAMEPAPEGRSTDIRAGAAVAEFVPQWSPPPDDGSTGLPNVAYADDIEPQWSPPSDGGKTRHEHAPAVNRAAAIEPALEQREHGVHKVVTGVTDDVPQWSPPVTGGNTMACCGLTCWARSRNRARLGQREHAGIVAVGADLDLAAMEPAAERRENGHSVHFSGHDLLAAMEPAAQPREHTCTGTWRRRCCGGRNGARRPTAGAPTGRSTALSGRSGRNGAQR
jgi:hypothetical protein